MVQEKHGGPRGTECCLIHGKELQKPIYLKGNSYIRCSNPQVFESKFSKKEYTRVLALDKPLAFSDHHNRLIDISIDNIEITWTEEESEWKNYFNIYKEVHTKRKTDQEFYEWPLFEGIFKLSKQNRKLWVVRSDNQILAGALCFYWNKTINYWHGARVHKERKKGLGHKLQDAIIRDAIAMGYNSYDMGNSTGLPGVDRFKAGFGAVIVPNYFYYKESLILRILNRVNKLLK